MNVRGWSKRLDKIAGALCLRLESKHKFLSRRELTEWSRDLEAIAAEMRAALELKGESK